MNDQDRKKPRQNYNQSPRNNNNSQRNYNEHQDNNSFINNQHNFQHPPQDFLPLMSENPHFVGMQQIDPNFTNQPPPNFNPNQNLIPNFNNQSAPVNDGLSNHPNGTFSLHFHSHF